MKIYYIISDKLLEINNNENLVTQEDKIYKISTYVLII